MKKALLLTALMILGGLGAAAVAQEIPPVPTPTPKPQPQPPVYTAPVAAPTTLVDSIRIRTSFEDLIVELPQQLIEGAMVQPEERKRYTHLKYEWDFDRETDKKIPSTAVKSLYETLDTKGELLLRVESTTTYYDNGLPPAAWGLKLGRAGALLNADRTANLLLMTRPNALVKEVKPLTLDGVPGLWVRSQASADSSNFVISWHAYRSINPRGQKMQIVLTGKASELEIARQAIMSIKIGKVVRANPSGPLGEVRVKNKGLVYSLLVPSAAVASPVKEYPSKNGDIAWVDSSHEWNLPRQLGRDAVKIRLQINNWNAPFAKVLERFDPNLRTAEFLLMSDVVADQNVNPEFENYDVKVSEFRTMDGVKGGYILARKDRGFFAGWYTYREVGGKAQRLDLLITGPPTELHLAEKIISSFKLGR